MLIVMFRFSNVTYGVVGVDINVEKHINIATHIMRTVTDNNGLIDPVP